MLATRTLLQHKCQAGRCSPKVSARPIDILLSVWVENREQYASCKNMQLICILNHLQGNAIHSSCFAKWNKCHVCNKQPGSITVLSSTCKFEWCFCWCKKGKKNTCMSSAIPKARFSKGVDAPAADARRHSPSDNAPAPTDEYLSLFKIFLRYCLTIST